MAFFLIFCGASSRDARSKGANGKVRTKHPSEIEKVDRRDTMDAFLAAARMRASRLGSWGAWACDGLVTFRAMSLSGTVPFSFSMAL